MPGGGSTGPADTTVSADPAITAGGTVAANGGTSGTSSTRGRRAACPADATPRPRVAIAADSAITAGH
jgi:hypothetical protein